MLYQLSYRPPKEEISKHWKLFSNHWKKDRAKAQPSSKGWKTHKVEEENALVKSQTIKSWQPDAYGAAGLNKRV